MRVRMLKRFRDWDSDDEVDAAPEAAEVWIARGIAEAVDAPPPAASEAETAMLEPGERAVRPPARPKGR